LKGKEKSLYNKLQENLLDYSTSLKSTREKLSASFGQSDMIMACTNLIAQILKAVLNFLAEFPSNPQGIELALQIFDQVQNLGPIASKTTQNLSDHGSFNELVLLLDWIIENINTYLPIIK